MNDVMNLGFWASIAIGGTTVAVLAGDMIANFSTPFAAISTALGG